MKLFVMIAGVVLYYKGLYHNEFLFDLVGSLLLALGTALLGTRNGHEKELDQGCDQAPRSLNCESQKGRSDPYAVYG